MNRFMTRPATPQAFRAHNPGSYCIIPSRDQAEEIILPNHLREDRTSDPLPPRLRTYPTRRDTPSAKR